MTEPVPQATAWPPLIIAVAPNGARRTKADHPAQPMTPDELAETSVKCVEAGASMIHLHVRDAAGGHTLDVDAYRAATDAIRAKLGDRIVIQATSEAVGMYSPAQQMAMVRQLHPEAVSMAIRELIPDDEDEGPASRFLEWLIGERIQPQYILYSADEVVRFADLRKRGVIPGDNVFVLYVLGRYTKGQVSHPADLLPFLEVTGALNCHWGFCAFAALGHLRGGPAKAAVLSSAMTGLISGSSIANVVSTGVFTIPLMKRVGFSPEKAGSVEVASSVNGQIMPPVMGAAAFLMVEYVGISYQEVVKHAFLPAVISYIALFYLVDLEAAKAGMKGLPRRGVAKSLMQKLNGFLIGIAFTAVLSAIVYFGIGWTSELLGDAAGPVLGVVVLAVYVLLVRFAAKYPDL